jgi:hypothetical protein
MPNFCVRWPNGDFSVVAANSKEHAAIRLDEVGSVEPADIHLLPDFMCHYTLDEEGSLEVSLWGEEVIGEIEEKYYPLLNDFLSDYFLVHRDPPLEALAERAKAIEQEKSRDVPWSERDLVEGAEALQNHSDASGAYARAMLRSLKP